MKPTHLLLAAVLLGAASSPLSAAGAQTTSKQTTPRPGTPTQKKAPLSRTVRVSDPRLPFAVSLPRGWHGVGFKDGLSGVNIASSLKPPAALMRFNYLPRSGRTPDLRAEFRGFEGAVRQGGTTVKLRSERPARYGGVSGLTHVYDLSGRGKGLRMQVWFGLGPKNFYSFQLTDAASHYAR
ncbi:MAG: hypothetical protein ACR2J4_06965, partial [Deinococcus sp.]